MTHRLPPAAGALDTSIIIYIIANRVLYNLSLYIGSFIIIAYSYTCSDLYTIARLRILGVFPYICTATSD